MHRNYVRQMIQLHPGQLKHAYLAQFYPCRGCGTEIITTCRQVIPVYPCQLRNQCDIRYIYVDLQSSCSTTCQLNYEVYLPLTQDSANDKQRSSSVDELVLGIFNSTTDNPQCTGCQDPGIFRIQSYCSHTTCSCVKSQSCSVSNARIRNIMPRGSAAFTGSCKV